MNRVDFCRRNLSIGSQRALDALERHHPDIRVGVWVCMDECEVCARHPFARVDRREIVQASSADELWAALRSRLPTEDGDA